MYISARRTSKGGLGYIALFLSIMDCQGIMHIIGQELVDGLQLEKNFSHITLGMFPTLGDAELALDKVAELWDKVAEEISKGISGYLRAQG